MAKSKTLISILTGGVLIGGIVFGGWKYVASQSPRQVVRTEEGKKVTVEELSFHEGRIKTYGKIYKISDSVDRKPLMVFCHGLGSNAEWGDFLCRAAVDKGFVAYSFDFPGGSKSSRSSSDMIDMSVTTQVHDLKNTLSHLKKQRFVDPNRIYLVGHSQGGLVAALAAAEKNKEIKGLALIAPAFNIPAYCKDKYPKINKIQDTTHVMGQVLGRHYFSDVRALNPMKAVKAFKGPVMIIRGTEDDIVPAEWSYNASQAFPNATLESISGADHNFSGAARAKLSALVTSFLESQIKDK